MTHNSVQLRSKAIEKNASEFTEYQNLLIFGPPEHDEMLYLDPAKIITFDYCVYQSLLPRYAEKIDYSFLQTEKSIYDAALVYLPKSKRELELVLALIAPMLAKNADIFLVGEKKAGIASAAKKLDAFGSNNSKIDSAKHCQLWQVTLGITPKPFDINNWFDMYTISLNNITMHIATIPGVFSFGELDGGTKLLLNNMFSRLEGRVIDFGCGSGVLGVFTKLVNPGIQLEMVDINLLALACTERTCALNDVEASVYPSNGWSKVKGRVNGVVTNPPFHSGVSTEYQTAESFIRMAKDKMSKHAPFLLVANNFLRYASIIEATFGRSDVLAENSKFRVYKTFR